MMGKYNLINLNLKKLEHSKTVFSCPENFLNKHPNFA